MSLLKELVIDTVMEVIKEDEGFRAHVYTCPAGKLTVGFGRNLEDRGVTIGEAEYMLQNDVNVMYRVLDQDFAFFKNLSVARQVVLISMAYQMGVSGLKRFRKMISALFIGDYDTAAFEMQNSRWYRQTTNRAERLIKSMQEG